MIVSTTNKIPVKKNGYWGAFMYVLIVLLCLYPYVFNSVYLTFLPTKTIILEGAFLLMTMFLFFMGNSSTSALRPIMPCFLMQLFGFLIVGVAHINLLPAIGHTLTMLLAIVLILFVDSRMGLVRFYEKYNGWLLLMAIMGCVAFFLVEAINIQPVSVVPDRADGRLIFNYLITFSKSDVSSIGIMRYAGFFDEPGAIAYWGIYALVINRLFIKNKWIETILGISLLFTLSIGYYVQYAAFLLLFHSFGKRRGQTLLLITMVLVVMGGIYLTRDTTDNVLYNYTFGRIENMFTESKENSNTIAVGDRSDLSANALREFQEHPLFGTTSTDVNVGNNIYEPLALYGIIGTSFILFPFLLLVIWGSKYKDYDLLKCSIVIILGFTHRPFHSNVLSFFLLYSIFIMYKQMRFRRS